MSEAPNGSTDAAGPADSDDRARRLQGELDAALDALVRQLDEVGRELESGRQARLYLELNERTRGWKALTAYREARARLRTLRTPAPLLAPAQRNGAGGTRLSAPLGERVLAESIRFARPTAPAVSVVVPVHGHRDLTLRCLAVLAQRTPHDLIEVIVVDDASDSDTAAALKRIEGLTLLRNARNAGFVDACRRGADAAQGDHLVFLNNDTEVQPGWLAPLLDAAAEPDVGAVGSKLVYPDGTLQEAGGVVWSDASGWNLGRGEHADHPAYGHRREVDYCSAAALLVSRDAYREVGGFDRRFAPGYYEDTDLCFALWAAGYRVLVEPRSVVIHQEGATHGTELAGGLASAAGKPLQRRHRHVFAVKWADELARHRPPGAANGILGGRVRIRPRILVVDAWVPAADRDSGSLRMTWILRLLRELGCDATLFPLNRERREPYTTELRRLGVEVHHGPWGLDDLLARQAGLFDAVVVSRPDVAASVLDDVRRAFPRAALIYDTVDLHFLREERRRAVLGDEGSDAERTRRVELDAMRRSDLVATVTEAEAALVRERVPGARTVVLPNVHEVDAAQPLPFAARRDVLFIGGFAHDPNVDAARHLVEDVMPLVWRGADTRVWIVGSEPPDSVRALASDRVVVTGHVPDPSELFRRAKAFVAPLRYGAGMKGKVGHAMAFGLPVVTTPVGAEGMDLIDGEHVLVRSRPVDVAGATLDLLRDADLWQRLATGSRALVQERWSPEAMRTRLEALVAEVVPPRARSGAS